MSCSDKRDGRWASVFAHQVNKGYSAFLMDYAKEENPEVEPEKIEAWIAGWTEAKMHTDRIDAAWKEKWPNYCTACGGWADMPRNIDSMASVIRLCERRPTTQCHRCGEHGLDGELWEGPCSACGWNFDDGLPSW